MTYPELQINLDLIDKEDRWDFITSNLPFFKTNDNKLFAVCKDGDCHLFDEDGNECDIDEVDTIYEFRGKYDELVAIKIPDCITDIGGSAFRACCSLTSVAIPDNVTSIGPSAFSNCGGLMNVMIGNNVISIGDGAFNFCDELTSVIIPDSVTHIGTYAFSNCHSLTSMTIGSGVTSIWYDAFYICKNLKSVVFKGKTIDQVKKMQRYPWGIEDESIIKCI